MQDEQKTKEQLVAELTALRQQVAVQEKRILDLEVESQQQTAATLQDSQARLKVIREVVEPEHIEQLEREEVIRKLLQGMLVVQQQDADRFRRIFEAGLVGMVFSNLNGNITDANNAFLQMIGYSRTELKARKLLWTELTPPELLHLDEQAIRELKQNGVSTPFEKECVRKDGSRVPVVVAGVMLEEASQSTFAFVLDISQRKSVERALRTAMHNSRHYASQLRGLMQASLAISSATSLEEMLKVITEQARSLIGAPQAITSVILNDKSRQAINVIASDKQTDWQQYEGRLDTAAIYALVRRINQPLHLTQEELVDRPLWQEFNRRAGQYSPMRGILAAPLIGRKGQSFGLIHVSDKYEDGFTDGDEAILVQLAQMAAVAIENIQLFEAAQEANRIKDEFLSICSHELRTPLNAILGWARLLRSRKMDEATTQRALETIERNATSQTQLIEDLLDISRIVTGKLRLNIQPVELASVIRLTIETVCLAAEAKNIQIKLAIDSTIGPILGDRDRLQQVVWNLLSNAIKFTPNGGQVEIQLSEVISNENELLPTTTYAQIQVIDTGQGINPDFLPYIFERFRQADSSSTRRYSGLGLGLAIVRHLVELHGGTIWADSLGEGQGTTFTVRLPLNSIRIESADAVRFNDAERLAGFEQNSRLEGLRLLVVDDEGDHRQLLVTVLESCGAVVTAVASVKEALQVLDQSQPNILISDIAMPDEDGYVLIRRIRSELSDSHHLPAIALTAYAKPEDRAAALLAGFQFHLSKPVNLTELVAVVASLAQRSEDR